MDLTHYASEPVTLDRERVYVQAKPYTHVKPTGLWVSVDGGDDWPAWCRDNEHFQDNLAHAHRVILTEDAHILHISTDEQLIDLHGAYSIEDNWTRRLDAHQPDPRFIDWSQHHDTFSFRQRPMDWGFLATQYQGLIIAPYLWDSRLFGPGWYYGFDCASGCIWDLTAVESFSTREIRVITVG